jgi:hypothetical protein
MVVSLVVYLMFKNIPGSLIIKKNHGKISYMYPEEIEELGIELEQGQVIYENTIMLNRNALMLCDYFSQNFQSLHSRSAFLIILMFIIHPANVGGVQMVSLCIFLFFAWLVYSFFINPTYCNNN